VRLQPGSRDEAGWFLAEVRFSALGGPASNPGKLVRVVICPETAGTFYVGAVELVSTAGPVPFEITVAPLEQGAVPRNRPVLFRAMATGDVGPALLTAYWDFDDRNGVGVDAQGIEALATFPSPGIYRVTCTAADLRGGWLSETKTLEVVVR